MENIIYGFGIAFLIVLITMEISCYFVDNGFIVDIITNFDYCYCFRCFNCYCVVHSFGLASVLDQRVLQLTPFLRIMLAFKEELAF